VGSKIYRRTKNDHKVMQLYPKRAEIRDVIMHRIWRRGPAVTVI
jgi:hypothetical protein